MTTPFRLRPALTSAAMALALATTALPALAQESVPGTTPLTEAEREQFRAEVRAYLLDNPEVIMEAVTLLQSREAEAAAQADVNLVSENAKAIFDDGFSWVGGNPDGDITLVEFLDTNPAGTESENILILGNLNAYAMRPFKLTLIDGGYASFGSAIIGAVLTLF